MSRYILGGKPIQRGKHHHIWRLRVAGNPYSFDVDFALCYSSKLFHAACLMFGAEFMIANLQEYQAMERH